MAVLFTPTRGRWRDRPVRVGVRAVHAGARHLVGAVADAVAIGVRIEWARTRVRAVDVVAGAGLGAVGQAIAVVVAVCHEAGRRALGRVVVARQVVRQAVSVVIGQAPQVEREGLGGAAVVRGGHGVGGGRHRSVDRAGDPARGRVDGEGRRGEGETVHVVVPLVNGGWKPIGSIVRFSTTVWGLSVSTLKYRRSRSWSCNRSGWHGSCRSG